MSNIQTKICSDIIRETLEETLRDYEIAKSSLKEAEKEMRVKREAVEKIIAEIREKIFDS